MSNILPFGPIRDYPERIRIIRPMSPADIARAMGEPREVVDLYDSLAANDDPAERKQPPTWTEIALCTLAVLALIVFVMMLDGVR